MSTEEEKEVAKFIVLLEKLRISHMDVQDEFQDYNLAIQNILSEIRSLSPGEFSVLKQKYLKDLERITQQIEKIQSEQYSKLTLNLKRVSLESIQFNQLLTQQEDDLKEFNPAHFYPYCSNSLIKKYLNFSKFTKQLAKPIKDNDVANKRSKNVFKAQVSEKKCIDKNQVEKASNILMNKDKALSETNIPKVKKLDFNSIQNNKKSKYLERKSLLTLKSNIFKKFLKPKTKNEKISLEQKDSAKVFVKEIDVDADKKSPYSSTNTLNKRQEDSQ